MSPLLSRLVGVAALAAALLAAATPRPLVVTVLGDSYASGEGLASATGVCGREPDGSWGALVAEGLTGGAARPTELALLACNGAVVEDVTVGGPLERPAQLAEAGPSELVLLTIGGNDLGFVEIVADCLGVAGFDPAAPPASAASPGGGSWSELVDGAALDTGCELTTAELLARVEALSAPDRFQVDAEGTTGGLAEVYVAVAERAVAPGGQLVVVGYPSLFAEPDRWPQRYGRRCHGLRADDADVLAPVIAALDRTIAEQVALADERLGDRRVRHVNVLDAYAGVGDGEDHRLCGGGPPWMNGLTVAEGGVDVGELLGEIASGSGLDPRELGVRPTGSFHPSSGGHRGTAMLVFDELEGR